jgi:hypothetical protein
MLKLKSIDENIRTTYNESDCYMKIRMTFEEKGFSAGVCYWNAYGLNRSLVELSLANPSGAIYDMTVPFFPVIHYQEESIINSNIVEAIGFPLFETHWNEYQKAYYHLPDDNINFNIIAGKKNTLLLFSSNIVVLHVINDAITFGFDADNNLCYIRMQNMALNDEGFLENVV